MKCVITKTSDWEETPRELEINTLEELVGFIDIQEVSEIIMSHDIDLDRLHIEIYDDYRE